MPEEMERKEEDGKKYVFHKGEWREIVRKDKTTGTKEGDILIELKIGNNILKGHARPTTYEKSKRMGYYVFLDSDQTAYGGGNIFIRT